MTRHPQGAAEPSLPSIRSQTFWVLVTAFGCWLGFPNPLGQIPLLVLFLPAGVFLLSRTARSPGNAFRRGLLAGTLGYAASLYWVALPVHDYGFLPWILAIPCPLLLGVYMGLYTAAFSWTMHRFGSRLSFAGQGILAGAVWGLLEILRGALFTGFPWLTLASALVPWPALIQAASLIGAQGLSVLLAACACWVASALASRGPWLVPQILVPFLLFSALAGWGAWRMSLPPSADSSLTVLLVQANMDQSIKWNPSNQNATVQRYRTMTREAVRRTHPNLVIWPETAMPFFFQEPSSLRDAVTSLAKETGLPLVTGTPAYVYTPGEKDQLFNRACLLNEEGRVLDCYDKEHLVPFGEYVPFGDKLPFLQKLVEGAGDFRSGDKSLLLRTGNLALGVLICYESIFPELAQQRVDSGANLLVNISNDAWFGRSSAPLQHLHLSALRAVEQGRYLVRATNTGISAFVDPYGRILSQGGLFRAETMTGEVGVLHGVTPYHRYHGLLVPILSVIAVFHVLKTRRPRLAGR